MIKDTSMRLLKITFKVDLYLPVCIRSLNIEDWAVVGSNARKLFNKFNLTAFQTGEYMDMAMACQEKEYDSFHLYYRRRLDHLDKYLLPCHKKDVQAHRTTGSSKIGSPNVFTSYNMCCIHWVAEFL